MSTSIIKVTGVAPTTSEASLQDFFSFCGQIQSIDVEGSPESKKSAVIHFVKPSAAHTALMLNGGTLDGAILSVTSDTVPPAHHQDNERHVPGHPIDQADKPRAGIAAEYLAKGYKLSDHILQRAIEIDNKQGISKSFLSYMQSLDTSVGTRALGPDQTISGKVQSTLQGATTRAKTVDEQKGYSKAANEYYSKAITSPLGQKVLAFYTSTSKQVLDIHEEARRIADQHKAHASAGHADLTPGAEAPAVAASAPAKSTSDAQPDPSTQAAPTVL